MSIISFGFLGGLFRGFRVINATPRGIQDKMPGIITIVFSKPLIALKSVSDMQNLKLSKYLSIKPAIKGTLQFKSTDSLAFLVDRDSLKPNTRYRITVKGSIKSLTGKKLGSDYKFHFDNNRFITIGSSLRRNDKHVLLRPSIFLYFNQPIDIDSASKYIYLNNFLGKKNVKIKKADKKEYKKHYVYTKFVKWRQFYRLYYKSKGKLFVYKVITPKLRKNTSYRLVINKKLKSTRGNLPLYKSAVSYFKTYGPLKKIKPDSSSISIRPTASINFKFSNSLKIDKKKLAKYIYAKNEKGKTVKLKYLSYYKNSAYFYVRFDFKPKKSYTVTIKRGLKDIYGQKLRSNINIEVETKDYYPKFSIPYPSTAIIESYGKINKLPMSFINLDKLKIEVNTYHSPNSFTKNNPDKNSITILNNNIQKRNTRYLHKLNLEKHLNRGYGLIRIKIKYEHEGRKYRKRKITREYFFQFSRLAITLKYSPKNIFVYVTDLKTSRPVSAAEIYIYTKKNKKFSPLLFRGRTNRRGYLTITRNHRMFKKLYKRYTYYTRLKIFAKKGRDFCLLDNGYNNKINLYNTAAGYPGSSMRKYYSYVFTPKGIYKKNETVVIKGYIRNNIDGKLVPSRWKKYTLKCSSSDGKVVLKKTIKTSRYGSFDLKYKLPSDPTLGRYFIKISEKDKTKNQSYHTPGIYGSFMVEAYRPRDFEVSVSFGKKRKTYKNGDELPLLVKGNFLYGGIMKHAKLKYRIEAYTYHFSTKKPELKDFRFSSNSWISSEKDNKILSKRYRASIRYLTKSRLNKHGVFNKKIKASVPFYTSARYVASAEIEDKKRQSVVAKSAVIVHKGRFYIGYKMKNYFISRREPLKLSIAGVRPNGRSAGRIPVEIKIYRIEWNNVRKLSSDGTYRWISKKQFKNVKTLYKKTSGSHKYPGKLNIRLSKAGSYIITFKAKDKHGNLITNLANFWVWGGGYVPWQMNDDQTIELVKNKSLYRIGETAKIMVKSPYKKVDALITVEREGVIDVYRRTIRGTADIVKIPIKKSYSPNVFVSIMLLQGRLGNKYPLNKLKDIYKPTVKIGYAVLYVKKDRKRLRIRIKSDKNRYEPGQRVRLNIRVRDYRKWGVKSELALYVIDEGVLSLIGYKTPDPFTAFYKNRQLLVRTFNNRLSVLGQHRYKLKGEDPGGGGSRKKNGKSSHGLSNISIRKIFKAIAYSKSSIMTSYNGYANVSFKLPDNLTKFRIMVIAVDAKDKFGSASKHIRVTKNLIIKPALPRFMTFRDKMQAGVVIDNNTGTKGIIDVYAKAKGIKLKGKSWKRIHLDAHGTKEVRFRFLANKIGSAVFTFKAVMRNKGRKYSDGLKWTIPVKMPNMIFNVAKSDYIDRGSKKEKIIFPANIYRGMAGLEFLTSSTALIRLKGSVEYLFNYPYGCIEQKMSKVIPMLLAGNLVREFKLKVGVNYKKLVQGFINEIYKYQNKNTGGFYYWPEKRYWFKPSPYLTVHALYMLWMGKKRGYSIDKKVYRLAVKYVKNYLRRVNIQKSQYPYSDGYWTSTDALALYILSEMKMADKSYVDSIYAKMPSQPIYTKAIMINALYNMDRRGFKNYIKRLVNDIAKNLKYEGSYAYVNEDGGNFSYYRYLYLSNTKSTAAVLKMLISVEKRNPLIPKLLKGIMKSMRNGRWRTTQENMYVFWALSKYFKTYEKTRPYFSVDVTSGFKKLFKSFFRGRSLKVNKQYRTFSEFPGNKKAHTLLIKKRGRGRLYYTIRLKYTPKNLPKSVSRGFKVRKKVYDVSENKEITDNKFSAGRVYRVELTIDIDSDRHMVVVDDPLLAGFEAINPRLKQSTLSRGGGKTSYSGSWWYGFNRVAMKDDRVCLFANTLKEGRHVYTYHVKATTYGNFNMYPTKAEEMYYPEIFGTSNARKVIIK